MASPLEVAREIFEVAKDDADFVAELQAAHKAAVKGGIGKGGFDFVTNASKNGGALTVIMQLSEVDRIKAIRYALKWVAAGSAPVQSYALGRF
jgi:hypothetical protein